VLQFSLGENTDPMANRAVIETMMNRASVRKQTLERALKVTHHRGDGGYYPPSTPAGGARNMRNAKLRQMAEENLRAVLGGSNVSSYATDNSSGGLAVRDRGGAARGGGNRFFYTPTISAAIASPGIVASRPSSLPDSRNRDGCRRTAPGNPISAPRRLKSRPRVPPSPRKAKPDRKAEHQLRLHHTIRPAAPPVPARPAIWITSNRAAAIRPEPTHQAPIPN
jgi:hypothetical protein